MRLIIAVMALAAASTQAAVYKWTDGNGTVHYSDHPHQGSARLQSVEEGRNAANTVPGLTSAERAALRRIRAEEDARAKARREALERERKATEANTASKEYCYRLDRQIQDYQERMQRGGSQSDLDRWQKEIDLYRSRERERCSRG